MLFIFYFTLPFTLMEETFAMVYFCEWQTKFAKINSTEKKIFTPFVQINSCEKNYLFHENKFGRKELSDLFWEKKNYREKRFPRKLIPRATQKILINLPNISFLLKLSVVFSSARFLLGIICSISNIQFETAIYIHSDKT